jgi:agmatine deiminase
VRRMSRVSRRAALWSLAGLGGLVAGAAACGEPDRADPGGPAEPGPAERPTAGHRFGAEWEPQARTFMSWPTEDVWGAQVGAVQRDIAGLARAIADHQAVVLLARPELAGAARGACGNGVEVVPIPVDDLWARDTLPVFVERAGQVAGVDLNFNGWGDKQRPHDADSAAASALLDRYQLPRISTTLVAEGGALETDGLGTLLVTESSIVNGNRNPGRTRDQLEGELKALLGVEKVIWFAGVRGQDITDAHVDCLVRFAAPGVVLLDRSFPGAAPDVWSRSSDQARTVLQGATDARGGALEVVDLTQPDPDEITGRGAEFVSSYLNFYVANTAVFLPRFGDSRADDHASQIVREHFAGREIVQVGIDAIAAGGGGIHCATHDQPSPPPPG